MSETKVVTGKVRFSYAHVHKPQAMDEQAEAKYSVSILVPKGDKVTLNKIKAAVENAKASGILKWGGKIPKNLKTPLRDGDIDKEDDDVYAGHFFFTASSKRKPEIVDANRDPIMSADEFYSGCFGRASLNFYAYANKSNGVACGLNNLQKLEDGERLGADISSAEDDFGTEEDPLLG